MPTSFIDLRAALALVGPLLLLAASIGALMALASAALNARDPTRPQRQETHQAFIETTLYASAFAFLGAIAGFMTGNSRSSAVGDLVPAVLALFGALSAALLATNSPYRALATSCAVSLAAATFIGTTFGTQYRVTSQNSTQALTARGNLVARCLLEEERVKMMVELATRGESKPTVDLKCSEYPR